MAGDKLWKRDQRNVAVEFLGHEVSLPEFPYVFALLSGVPLFIFFSFRTGRKRYHFTVSEPILMGSPTRDQRKEAVRQAAQRYADLLQEAVYRNPFEWFHFEPFLGQNLGGALNAPNPNKVA
jgi:predicted LPLAT superfamily acyltransferase